MVVGAVIVAHRPSNTIGWIFSAIGLLAGTGIFAWQYAEYAYTTRGRSLPGATNGATGGDHPTANATMSTPCSW
jgi:hypothetical protein